MNIPADLQFIINRLYHELELLKHLANDGLNQLSPILDNFPNNDILVSFFASLNNVLFLVEVYERRIQALTNLLQDNEITIDRVKEMGEELGDLLGRIIETKIQIQGVVTRIEELS